MKKRSLFLIIITVLSACDVTKDVSKSDDQDAEMNDLLEQLLETSEEEKSVPVRPVYQATETFKNDLLHTKLEVSFLWKTKQLKGLATLRFKPYFYQTDKLVLDAKAMDINSVKMEGKDLTFDYDGFFLTINLGKMFQKNETYEVKIDYTANPEKVTQQGSSAISSAKGLYFINADSTEKNKPTQIWTQGETEASSCWFPTIDVPNEKTTQEIYITVDERYKTLSNGLLVYATPNKDGTRTDYWKQDQPHAPYLFMMAVGDFAVVEDTWTRKDGSTMAVNYYVEKEYEPHAKAIFGKTPKMLTAFSEMLGVEYPWDKYHQVVVRDYVSGAMENTTAVIHGDFLHQTEREIIDGGNESIIAHELFHHWFGDLVTCESWSNLPLNESFANYSQYLWDEYEYGREEADMNAFSEGEGYLLSSQQTGFFDMIRYDYDNKEEMFDAHSYNKGGRILHMLRTYVGDEAFFASLNLYLTQNAYKATEIDHLRLAFEEVTGEDLHWFFNQWFLDKGHPTLAFSQTYDATSKQLTVIIQQQQNFEEVPLYKLPLNIDIYNGANARREMVWVDAVADTFTFDVNAQPDLVNIDADKVLLGIKKDKKPTEQWVHQLRHAPLWLDKKEAIDRLGKSSNTAAKNAIVEALDHPFWHVKVMATSKLKRAVRDNKELVKKKLKRMTNHDHPKVRSAAIRALKNYYDGDSDLMTVYEAAMKDPSYKVMSQGIEAVAAANPDRAMMLAKKYEKEEGPSVIMSIASIYADHGGKEEHNFFLNAMDRVTGFEKFGFLRTYNKYLLRQDEKELNKGIEVFENVARNGSPWFIKLSGYQLIKELEGTYREMAGEHQTKVEMLKKEGKTMDATQAEQDAVKALNKADELKRLYDEIKAAETDNNVLQYIDKV